MPSKNTTEQEKSFVSQLTHQPKRFVDTSSARTHLPPGTDLTFGSQPTSANNRHHNHSPPISRDPDQQENMTNQLFTANGNAALPAQLQTHLQKEQIELQLHKINRMVDHSKLKIKVMQGKINR
jgi:hypothetical protein